MNHSLAQGNPMTLFRISALGSVIILGLLGLVGGIMSQARAQKVVLITGSGSGIGLATTQAFQKKGWKVWAGYHKTVPNELKASENIRFRQLDVTNDAQIQAIITDILKEDGRIDVLINNAGYGLIGAEETVTIDEARALFDVNFFGVLRLIQAVLPTMRKQYSGHILNISSGVGVHSYAGLGLYSASKFALESLSESLAATVSPWNIQVSIIEPGFVKTDWGKKCAIGSRMGDVVHYKTLTKSMQDMLFIPQGQPSTEVASLLLQIAENPHPDMRYQTSAGMKEYIAERLIDPTGNSAKQSNIEFVNRLISDAPEQ